jgi:uncharacterized repeat protein (TIGR03803 family)
MNYRNFLVYTRFAATMIVLLAAAVLVLTSHAWAASDFRTLYAFPGGESGSQPFSGLVMDKSGTLYGTTYVGGIGSCLGQGCGVVFKLVPNKHGRQFEKSSDWAEIVIHSFNGEDGANPQTASLIIDKHGNLFGTTEFGGIGDCHGNGCGVAFELSTKGHDTGSENILHRFSGDVGVNPVANLTFDDEGNLYGTTSDWSFGFTGPGVVFKLTPEHDGEWTETILHTFNGSDGFNPSSGVIFDPDGNLYGTTIYGGDFNQGVVYRLSPNSDGSWTESVLHSFTGGNDGYRPQAGLVRDSTGNLFGVTAFGGENGYGTVFQLQPNGNGSWSLNTIYAFKSGEDGANSFASLVFDKAGALFGTTHDGGTYDCGVVFRLTPEPTGVWNEQVIHTFDNKPECESFSPLIFDRDGNLYGTTRGDGTTTFGSVFEITP